MDELFETVQGLLLAAKEERIQQKREVAELKELLEVTKKQLEQVNGELAKRKNQHERYQSADNSNAYVLEQTKKKLQKTNELLNKTQKELDETKSRLSKMMGSKLTDANPNVADLSDGNRPTNLAERYTQLYDNQWTDAFEKLDYGYEKKTINKLMQILIDAYEFCSKRSSEQLKEALLAFGLQMENENAETWLKKLLKDLRKQVAPINVKDMFKQYCKELGRTSTGCEILQVTPYVRECFEICWFAVAQDPPVVIGSAPRQGTKLNTELYKAYTSSGLLVEFVVWPPLLLHEGGPVLCKGVAQGYNEQTLPTTAPGHRMSAWEEKETSERVNSLTKTRLLSSHDTRSDVYRNTSNSHLDIRSEDGYKNRYSSSSGRPLIEEFNYSSKVIRPKYSDSSILAQSYRTENRPRSARRY